ncbi:hypothetical protein CAOG_003073 [Capsaspora owczarzaki ATCC 30864]|uniref:Chromosome transmission fidelity protein 18 n=1 Tax=Capsaspora owczarzaki (strain ATCC 30864) TaxID=595528 RepID=A0A0D2UAI0_CAPO3|nr:hypothetical protein CAOG_003073 [Capsaspora owczarzaki ATCC 30864]
MLEPSQEDIAAWEAQYDLASLPAEAEDPFAPELTYRRPPPNSVITRRLPFDSIDTGFNAEAQTGPVDAAGAVSSQNNTSGLPAQTATTTTTTTTTGFVSRWPRKATATEDVRFKRSRDESTATDVQAALNSEFGRRAPTQSNSWNNDESTRLMGGITAYEPEQDDPFFDNPPDFDEAADQEANYYASQADPPPEFDDLDVADAVRAFVDDQRGGGGRTLNEIKRLRRDENASDTPEMRKLQKGALPDFLEDDPAPYDDVSDADRAEEEEARRLAGLPPIQEPRRFVSKGAQAGANTRPAVVVPKRSLPTGPKLTKRPPLKGDSMSLLDRNGDMWYVVLKPKPSLQQQQPLHERMSLPDAGHLLPEPVSVMMARLDAQRVAAVYHHGVAMSTTPVKKSRPSQPESSQLWVEKYAPRGFIDLISDPGTNRLLLSWLKQWDHCVFGKPRAIHFKPPPAAPAFKPFPASDRGKPGAAGGFRAAAGSQPQAANGGGGAHAAAGRKFAATAAPAESEVPVKPLPMQDPLDQELFRNRVLAAVEMSSVFGSENTLPNCLIIDEIDGSSAAAINALIAIATAGSTSTEKRATTGKAAKLRRPLQRPIICICNDIFARSLQALRQVALVVPFPNTSGSRLQTRLTQICKAERFELEANVLVTLCESTNNDIRSCINTLQFLSRHGKTAVSSSEIARLAVGQKDTQRGLFLLWEYTLQARSLQQLLRSANDPSAAMSAKDSKLPTGALFGESNAGGLSRELSRGRRLGFMDVVVPMITANGEYDTLLSGLYENYLSVRFTDPNMVKIQDALDWVAFYDQVHLHVYRNQMFHLMQYLPYTVAAFHVYCSAQQRQRLKFPKQHKDFVQALTQRQSIIANVTSGCTARVRAFLNAQQLVVDVASPLADVLSPNMRPITVQLLNAAERKQLAAVVDVILSFNLSFEQVRQFDGMYDYVLTPNLLDVVTFPTPTSVRRKLPYPTKQLIAHEVEIERLRQNAGEQPPALTPSASSSTVGHAASGAPPQPTRQDSKRAPAPNMDLLLGRSNKAPMPVKVEPKVVRDFFGRVVQVIEETSNPASMDASNHGPTKAAAAAQNALATFVTSYKFQEGFSNAVRHSVRIRDLL